MTHRSRSLGAGMRMLNFRLAISMKPLARWTLRVVFRFNLQVQTLRLSGEQLPAGFTFAFLRSGLVTRRPLR